MNSILMVSVFLAFSTILVTAKRDFDILLTSLNVTYNPKYVIANGSIHGYPSQMDFYINLLKEVPASYLTVDVSLPAADHFFQKTIDLCHFLKYPKAETIIYLIYENFLAAEHWFKSCPVKPGFYYAQNVTFDREKLPSYTPQSKFVISVSYFLLKNNEPIEICRGTSAGRIESVAKIQRRLAAKSIY